MKKKVFRRRFSIADKQRIVSHVDRLVRDGIKIKDAMKLAGVKSSCYYTWIKNGLVTSGRKTNKRQNRNPFKASAPADNPPNANDPMADVQEKIEAYYLMHGRAVLANKALDEQMSEIHKAMEAALRSQCAKLVAKLVGHRKNDEIQADD